MSPRPARNGWSSAQRQAVLIAARRAQWDSAHRHMVMRHCGCPLDQKSKRPSIKHADNTNRQFELFMSFAEPVARTNGSPLHPPRNHRTWEAVVRDAGERLRNLARRIIEEAIRELPGEFNSGLEEYIVRHVYSLDQSESGARFLEAQPESIEQCDVPTLIRVVDCLRAYVGRRFVANHIIPSSFKPTRAAMERGQKESTECRPSNPSNRSCPACAPRATAPSRCVGRSA